MKYRREIDGLRALAVLPVMLFHAGISIFGGGFVGVDIFFVISGYLITTIIVQETQANTFSIINFYERRARRILPALFFVMLVCLPFAWLWLLPNDMKNFSQSLVSVSYYVSNIYFWLKTGYFDVASELKPLLHTWSLAVEEQFYVFFPLIILLTWRLGVKAVNVILITLLLISLYFSQLGTEAFPTFGYFMLPTRAWELLMGSIVALHLNNQTNKNQHSMVGEFASVLGISLILFAIFKYNKDTPFPGLYAFIPTFGTCLIIMFANKQTIVGKVLGSNVFVGLGLISYSTYLWHQPLFAFARHRSLVEPSVSMFIALSVLAIILAYFTWRFVEAPFRNRNNFSRKQIFQLTLCFTLFFTIIGFAGHLKDGFKSRFPDELSHIAMPASFFTGQSINCHRGGAEFNSLEASCILGDKTHVIGALIGDSHANAISTQLGKDIENRHIGLLQMTFNGCPPVQGVYIASSGDDDKCNEFNAQVLSYLKAHKELEYVIISSRWTRFIKSEGFDNGEGGVEHREMLIDVVNEKGIRERNTEAERVRKIQERYIQQISTLLQMGKKVILIYPVPEVGWRAPYFLVKQKMFDNGPLKNSTSYELFKSRNRSAFDTLDLIGQHPNLFRVYPHQYLCDAELKGRCVFELNGDILYFDTNHLSNAGAKLINRGVLEFLPK